MTRALTAPAPRKTPVRFSFAELWFWNPGASSQMRREYFKEPASAEWRFLRFPWRILQSVVSGLKPRESQGKMPESLACL